MPDRDEDRLTVSIRKCESYESTLVDATVRRAVADIGGIERFVSPGDRILVKPNMLIPRRPEEAITTHPEILRVAIRLVKEAGGVAVVGDSPAGRSTERILRHLAERTGVAKVCDEEGVEFVLFTQGAKVPYPDGVVAKSFEMTSVVSETDGVISLAKLKTHSLTVFTGAVKNLFGLVHGLKKAEYHMRMKDPESFSEMLVDLAECVRPRLTVMDGVVGMDGDGPSAGRVRGVGVIMASANPHALDLAALEVVGADPDSVWTVSSARRRGLLPSSGSGAGVRVVGDDVASLDIAPFKMPPKLRVFGAIPSAIGGFVAEAATRKPVFLSRRCVRCGSCVEICPAEALSIGSEKGVDIDRPECIRCYCCQEVCPEKAVELRRMPVRSLGRALLSKIRRKGA
jgi:uncharacterized protein (DUF362 family)/NAD-dependent dihydropyrimidine dehydrogenase PreA subunit